MNKNEQNETNYINKKSSKRLFNLITLQVYAAYSIILGAFIIFEIIIGEIGAVAFFSVVGALFILSGILLLLFLKKRWKTTFFLISFVVYIFASFLTILLLPHNPDLIEILIVISVVIPILIGIAYLLSRS